MSLAIDARVITLMFSDLALQAVTQHASRNSVSLICGASAQQSRSAHWQWNFPSALLETHSDTSVLQKELLFKDLEDERSNTHAHLYLTIK